jgi:putative flippase GtrA
VITREFALFVVAGGIAAVVNFGSRILFSLWIPYVPAILLAYCVGMLTAFIINRQYVFATSDRPLHHQVWWFTAVNVAAVIQTVVISVLFDRWLFPATGMIWHPESVAHAIGLAVPVFTSYVGHKYLTFRVARPGSPLGGKGVPP